MDLLTVAEANGRSPKSQPLYLHGFVFVVKNGKCKGKFQINLKKSSQYKLNHKRKIALLTFS